MTRATARRTGARHLVLIAILTGLAARHSAASVEPLAAIGWQVEPLCWI